MKAIIFDIDGVFRNTNTLNWISVKKALGSIGSKIKLDKETLAKLRFLESLNHSKNIMSAARNDEVKELIKLNYYKANRLGKKYGVLDKEIEKASAVFKEVFYDEESRKHVKLINGGKEALERLKNDFKLGVVSNTLYKSLERDIPHLLPYFDAVVSRDMVNNIRKPNPAGILKCCEMLNIQPKDALFVGDSAVDVIAARNAGTAFCGVLTGMGVKKWFEDLNTQYVESIAQIPEFVREMCE